MACAGILLGKALRNQDDDQKKVSNFVTLYKTEWKRKVSSHARSSVAEIKQNTPDLLPCTDDLQKLCVYQKQRIDLLAKTLVREPSKRHLAKSGRRNTGKNNNLQQMTGT